MATVLGMGEMWLYHRKLWRVIPVAKGQRCMALLMGLKQLALIQGDNARRHVAAVLISLPDADDNASAEGHLT